MTTHLFPLSSSNKPFSLHRSANRSSSCALVKSSGQRGLLLTFDTATWLVVVRPGDSRAGSLRHSVHSGPFGRSYDMIPSGNNLGPPCPCSEGSCCGLLSLSLGPWRPATTNSFRLTMGRLILALFIYDDFLASP